MIGTHAIVRLPIAAIVLGACSFACQSRFLWATLRRNGFIAIVAGGLVALFSGGLSRWPAATLLALWPSFGGHWVEVVFLVWLRPRLSDAAGVRAAARLATWFAGGILLAIGMELTAWALGGFPPVRWPAWWIAGAAFAGIELVVHLALQFRGLPSFYNGRG